MTDVASKVKAVHQFIRQAPPGQVNDVFSDVRALVADDAALEQGARPALEAYNLEQFTSVQLPDANKPAVLCKAARLDQPNSFFDPRSKQIYEFDHVELAASKLETYEADAKLEDLRLALQEALTSYVEEHYSQSNAAVFALGQRISRKPVSQSEPSLSEVATESNEGAIDVDRPDSKVDTDSSMPASNGDIENGSNETLSASQAPNASEEDVDMLAKDAEPKEATNSQDSTADSGLLPCYALYTVGNRYNPSNFWSGRWRSEYKYNAETASLNGTIHVNVHYYEQGNVQLQTELPLSLTVAQSTSDVKSQAAAVIKTIDANEKKYQVALNEAYAEMSDKTFKELRRALPITKQKMNWSSISYYKLSGELQKA